jgi:hypothetical protein
MPYSGAPLRPPAAASRPAETNTIHTRILRCMLAVDDSYAYWQRVDTAVPIGERARQAFERRWFGTKSEARIRTMMTDMTERFDAYPEALGLFHEIGTVPAHLRPYICHLHTQLADPIYRRFTGKMLPNRRDQGQTSIDRDVVARWIDSLEPGRWSPSTCQKFGSNLLATASDAGLVVGKKDPRKIPVPATPDVALGYATYLLRDVQILGTLERNPYLRSLGVDADGFGRLGARVPGLRITELGGVFDIAWLEASLRDWGMRHLGGSP